MTETEDLRQQLVAALKSRAMMIAALFESLAIEIGQQRAQAVMSQALHARGAAAGERFFSAFAPADFPGLRDRFIDFLPDHGRLFEIEVARCDADGLDLAFLTCPLKQAWVEAGVAPDRMQALCAIAGQIDTGTFEGAGFAIRNETWQPGAAGCCHLRISRRP